MLSALLPRAAAARARRCATPCAGMRRRTGGIEPLLAVVASGAPQASRACISDTKRSSVPSASATASLRSSLVSSARAGDAVRACELASQTCGAQLHISPCADAATRSSVGCQTYECLHTHRFCAP